MDYERLIRERIARLCIEHDMSEYQLSSALGHAHSYINSITRGKTLPSMKEFLALCDFFEISPSVFFDDSIDNPVDIADLLRVIDSLSSEQIKLLIALASEMSRE